MTNKELQEELKKYDENMPVCLNIKLPESHLLVGVKYLQGEIHSVHPDVFHYRPVPVIILDENF